MIVIAKPMGKSIEVDGMQISIRELRAAERRGMTIREWWAHEGVPLPLEWWGVDKTKGVGQWRLIKGRVWMWGSR